VQTSVTTDQELIGGLQQIALATEQKCSRNVSQLFELDGKQENQADDSLEEIQDSRTVC